MTDVFQYLFSQHGDETIFLLAFILFVIVVALIASWIINKRKFNQLVHQIPASVVQNYLDTIIQNSNALKSSLSRGGEFEVGPAVVQPAAGGDVSSEVLNAKNAEIASLRNQIYEKDRTIQDLEKQLNDLKNSSDNAPLLKEIDDLKADKKKLEEDLEAAKNAAPTGGGDTEALEKEVSDLKERLKEYEIIEDDLANLKKLQIENKELKDRIAELEKGASAAPPPPPPPAPEPAAAAPPPPPEPAPEPPSEDNPELGQEKSADDLLSEFEKMLG